RARVPQAGPGHGPAAVGRRERGPRAGLDPDVPADGRGAGRPAAGPVPGSRPLMPCSPRAVAVGIGLVALAAVPLVAAVLNQPFYLDLFRRIMIFAIAALSLDLILGYGGMVSFGHAAYLGVGAYAVGVLTHHGVQNGFVQWGLAIVGSAAVALSIGAVSIRTSGVYFIMITLAFTQMLYYLGISIAE